MCCDRFPLKSRTRLGIACVGAFLALLVTGCGSSPDMTSLRMEIEVGDDVNPNEDNKPSPVVLRIYYLLNADEFQRADFFDLFNEERKTLGQDLIGSREFELLPGMRADHMAEIALRAKYIAVMAAFRDLEVASWRSVVPLEQGADNVFAVRLDLVTVAIRTPGGGGWSLF